MSAALRLEETARPHTAYEMGFLLRYFSYRAKSAGWKIPAGASIARKCTLADEVLLHQSYCTL